MRISEAFEEYGRSEILAVGRSMKTYQNYHWAGRSVEKFFGNIQIEDLTLVQVQEYYLAGREIWAQNTARVRLVCLRSVLRFCRSRGLKVTNPDDIRTPEAAKSTVSFLTAAEVDRFVQLAGESRRGYSRRNRLRNQLIVRMLFETGLRVGELVSLDRDSIRDRQFSVIGKSKEARVCFITEGLEEMIVEYLATRHDNNRALFVSEQGDHRRLSVKTVQELFRRICRQSQFEGVHPHTMRHSFGTFMLESGVDIRDVSALLGHQSLETTKVYTHVTDRRLRAIHEAVMGKARNR